VTNILNKLQIRIKANTGKHSRVREIHKIFYEDIQFSETAEFSETTGFSETAGFPKTAEFSGTEEFSETEDLADNYRLPSCSKLQIPQKIANVPLK
jgi:hypothetical protein